MKAKSKKRAHFANVLSAKPETRNPSQFSDQGPQNAFLGNRDARAARRAPAAPTSGMGNLDREPGDYFRPPPQLNGQYPQEPDWSITPARVTLSVRMRFNAIKGLTFERLSSYLDQWQLGFFRMAGITWDQMQRRDYQLRVDVPKRRRAAARHGWQIMLEKDIPAADKALAQDQQRFLQKFYSRIQTTSAINPDEHGGVRLLAYQMLDAIGVYISAHEIIWQPQDDGDLTAKFIHVPVWWLEGTRGKVRFLQSEFQVYGVDINPGEWLITTGDGLMEASSVVYMFKSLPLRSWVQLLDRLGGGGIVGKTPAQYGSPEWQNMVDALRQFADDWAGVFSANTDISLLEAKNVVGEGPFNAIINRMDQAITCMWRGTSLSTNTSGSGEQGASVQAGESEIFETDDPLILQEALKEQVSNYALAWKYGPDAPQYAYLSFAGPPELNVKDDIAVDTFLSQFGVLGKESTLKRYNRPMPAAGEEVLQPPAPPTPEDQAADKDGASQAQITNSGGAAVPRSPVVSDKLTTSSCDHLAAAVHDDLAYAAGKVAALLKIDDPDHFKTEAEKLAKAWDQITGNTLLAPSAADALARIAGTSFANGLQRPRAEMANQNDNHDENNVVSYSPKNTSGKEN